MKLRLAHRRYSLPFRTPMRTAHGLWAERTGVIVRLTDEAGAVGYGEAAPIAWFGTETMENVIETLGTLGEWVTDEQLAAVPADEPCLHFALWSARAMLAERAASVTKSGASRDDKGEANARSGDERDAKNETDAAVKFLPVAGLLPAGRAVLAAVPPKAELGFRTFKWKVGVGDLVDELSLLDDVIGALPTGAALRLDANGAWERRQAERWLERAADRPVEFIEQPIAPTARGADDVLRGLAEDFPTPLALDESLVGAIDVERWIGAGWRGVFVLKPLLLGDPRDTLARLRKAKADVVFSSALETAIGAQAALRLAFAWAATAQGKAKPRALGFGVGPLFSEMALNGPQPMPFIRVEDVARLDADAAWRALA